MTGAIVNIKAFSGQAEHRELQPIYENIRCILSPASPQVAAFYEDVPMGQLYEYLIIDQRIQDMPDGAEIEVCDPQKSGLAEGSIFIAIARRQRQRVGGRFILTGPCSIKE
jgi:hypothetical protein